MLLKISEAEKHVHGVPFQISQFLGPPDLWPLVVQLSCGAHGCCRVENICKVSRLLGVVASRGLLVVQFQQVSNGLVLLLWKLDDRPRRLQVGVRTTPRPGEAAQVSGRMGSRSERIRVVRWCRAGRHDGLWGVEPGEIKSLKTKKK